MFESEAFVRKFQCFICGELYESFEEFKEHIKSSHTEGTDYVLCPLGRCGAPVRDLRAHFKAKHPADKIPKEKLMRATIWRDFSPTGKKKGQSKKPKFREGYFASMKMGKKLHYRSGYECTIYECLDAWDQVTGFAVEPFEIPYVHLNEVHKYIPDLFVTFSDGHHEVWEIKPANQTELQKNLDKWESAKRACKARGWSWKVQTEAEISALKKLVQRQAKSQKDAAEDLSFLNEEHDVGENVGDGDEE